jgi:hypothetical protein
MKRVWFGASVLAMVIVSGLARADDESDRRGLISRIDSKLDDAAGKLSGLADRSDASELNDALGYIKEAESYVSDLSRVKEGDTRANEIVSKYPAYIRSFREAAGYAIKLKAGQRLADGGADACKSDEADLQTLIRNYVADPNNAQEAPGKLVDKGRQYGSKWTEKLSAWERNNREMASAASYARFSVSDGKWSNVSSYFADSVSRIGSYWMSGYEAAARACERLAKGERHPDIEKAIADLASYAGNSKQTYKALEADYREWLKDIQKLRQFSADDRDEMRKAMCFGGEYEVEQKVNEIADRWANNINSSYATALGQADRLARRAEDVKARAPKSAPKLQQAIKDVMKSLENLSQYELKGSNNPKLRAKLEYGKRAHQDKQSSCSYAELEISSSYCDNRIRPGSGCRLDCVMTGSTCTIYEIKPDSDGAQNEGRSQLASYKAALEKWYAQEKAGLFNAYSNLQQCEKDGRLDLRTDLVTYSFCPSSASELGEKLEPIAPDVSSEGD